MKYIVYQTINLINYKIYIGVHKTQNPEIFDGYFGCGVSLEKRYFMEHPKTYFQKALKKYGFKNFKRITLAVFDTAEEAFNLESLIVTKEFIKRKDTYNLALGGGSGGSYYNKVYQFSLDGKLLDEWDNNTVAAEAVGVCQPSICNAIKTKGSCAGYYWSRNLSIDVSNYTNHTGKEVFQYDSDGRLVNRFSTLTQAAKFTNDSEKTIYRAINSQMKRKGYYWSFVQKDKFIPTKISLRGATIYVYSLEGKYITELNSPKKIKEFFNITSYGNLRSALLNNKPYLNYQVSLEFVDKLPPITLYGCIAKKIGCFDQEGNLIETFPSIKQAVKSHGTKVVRVLRNQQSSYKGYTFKVL